MPRLLLEVIVGVVVVVGVVVDVDVEVKRRRGHAEGISTMRTKSEHSARLSAIQRAGLVGRSCSPTTPHVHVHAYDDVGEEAHA